MQIAADPSVLRALNPWHALRFIVEPRHDRPGRRSAPSFSPSPARKRSTPISAISAGSPIQTAWLAVVLPALALNYLGQGALVLADPKAIENPFFLLYPDWALLPMVGLATAATVIASQAVITGAYSLTRQAIQLGLLPRLEIRHTSESACRARSTCRASTRCCSSACCCWSSLFGSSSALASAYGIAVTGTMVVTALMAFIVIWKAVEMAAVGRGAADRAVPADRPDRSSAPTCSRCTRAAGCRSRSAAVVMLVMYTWRRGSRLLFDKTRRLETPLRGAGRDAGEEAAARSVPGTAVFLTSDPDQRADRAAAQPQALQGAAREQRDPDGRDGRHAAKVSRAGTGADRASSASSFSRVTLRFGFMETPNVPKALAIARKLGWQFDIMSTSFFLSRRSLKPAAKSGMPRWQDRLFIGLARSANDATDYFQIPTGRVVEIGTQVAV